MDRRRAISLAMGLVMTHADVDAQGTFPTRAITLVVGWPAGGPADNVARLIATQMSRILGQQIVIDNRPGAGGNIGSDLAARQSRMGTQFCWRRWRPTAGTGSLFDLGLQAD